MNKKLFFLLLFFCKVAEANYPGMDDKYICNGYDTEIGYVTNVVATTTYDSAEAVYVKIKLKDNESETAGGRIYPRNPTDFGYTPMVNIANIALVTSTPVKICVSSSDKSGTGNDIYAIELLGE